MLLVEYETNKIEYVIIHYSTNILTDIAIIPYAHYVKKQLKEHFKFIRHSDLLLIDVILSMNICICLYQWLRIKPNVFIITLIKAGFVQTTELFPDFSDSEAAYESQNTNKTDNKNSSYEYPNVSIERRNTYTIFKMGIEMMKPISELHIDESFEEEFDKWFMSVDMSGNAQEIEIVNKFSQVLDRVINDNETKFSYISANKPIDDKADIILHDDEYIYLASSFIDTYILQVINGDIPHRQLIRSLDAANMLNKNGHYCQ